MARPGPEVQVVQGSRRTGPFSEAARVRQAAKGASYAFGRHRGVPGPTGLRQANVKGLEWAFVDLERKHA